MSTGLAASDEQLCAAIARHDGGTQAAFGELYNRHARSLLAFLASRVERSDLEDVHQEIWLKVMHAAAKQFTGGSFRGWLFQISRNYLIDRSRKKRPQALPEELDVSDASGRPHDLLLERERMEILARCLGKLDEQAAALVRARLQGEGYEDICSRLRLESSKAHSLFHAAKSQLQSCVQRGLS